MRHRFLRAMFVAALAATVFSGAVYAAVAPGSDTDKSATSNFSDLPQVRWNIETVRKGDTLLKVFARADYSRKIALRLAQLPEGKQFNVIHPGEEIRFAHDAKGDLLGIEFRRSESKKVAFLIIDGTIEPVAKKRLQMVGSLSVLLDEFYEDIEEAAKLPMPEIDESRLSWVSVTVKRGDNLSKVFRKIGIPVREAIDLADSKGGGWLKNLKIGQELRIATLPRGKFAVLESHTSPLRVAVAIAGQDYYYHTERMIQPEVQRHQGCGAIATNLFDSGKEVGFNDRTLRSFVDVFGSRIDFARELKTGDEFCMIYEQKYVNEGQPVGMPEILAATYRGARGEVKAIRFVDPEGDIAYFDESGENLSGQFLRSPLKYGRVTSKFSSNRFHPVLKRWRPHHGVDYGARPGTPVMSTANGAVIRRHYNNSYGNYLVISHGSRYKTLYAHLKGFASGMRVGTRVKKGQVIGYVGRTGIATGPHLHYEFRVNNVHHDPLRYPLPNGKPIDEQHREQFLTDAVVWSALIKSINRDKPLLAYTPSVVTDEAVEPADNPSQ